MVPSDEVVTALGCCCTLIDSIAINLVTQDGRDMIWLYSRYVDVSRLDQNEGFPRIYNTNTSSVNRPPRVALVSKVGSARRNKLDTLR